jgi:osmotically-inducible protein OsmY
MYLPTRMPVAEGYLAAALSRLVAAAYAAGAGHADTRTLATNWGPGPALARPGFLPPPDAVVGQAVRAALRADPRLDALLPAVQVCAGVATLLGTLSNLRARQAAEQVARAVAGVRKVHNLLKVRSDAPDAAILAQVRAALLRNSCGGRRLGVQVRNGRVQLSGVVATQGDRERAADVAAGISGVVAITNYVRLGKGLGAGPAPAASQPASARPSEPA